MAHGHQLLSEDNFLPPLDKSGVFCAPLHVKWVSVPFKVFIAHCSNFLFLPISKIRGNVIVVCSLLSTELPAWGVRGLR